MTQMLQKQNIYSQSVDNILPTRIICLSTTLEFDRLISKLSCIRVVINSILNGFYVGFKSLNTSIETYMLKELNGSMKLVTDNDININHFVKAFREYWEEILNETEDSKEETLNHTDFITLEAVIICMAREDKDDTEEAKLFNLLIYDMQKPHVQLKGASA